MKPNSRRALVWALALAAVCAGLFIVGFAPRRSRAAQLDAARGAEASASTVVVATVKRAPAAVEVTLPGNVQAYQATAIYARANGYVKRRLADIGDRVAAGQLLAELETPELDEELRQAKAALGQARAQLQQAKTALELSRLNLERSTSLRARGIVPAQDTDERKAAFDAQQAQVESATANIAAAEANVERLTNLQSFKRVVAPFAGVITERTFDQGALITAGSASTARELFRIGQGDVLRVYVNVPQAYATALQPGAEASVGAQELGARRFAGRVVRTSGALDPASRTLLAEVQVKNAGDALLPGMYADVKIRMTRPAPPLLVPASALVVRNDGSRVAVVADGRVRFATVELGRDYGAEIEILAGLSDADTIVLNPSSALADGQRVTTVVR